MRSINDAFYSSRAWKSSRRSFLFDHPLCQYVLEDGTQCGEVADSVHHVIPIEDGGPKRDPANLMSVCRPHHSAIHAQLR
jgi:5-methylcytosine-specific restriction enzyme A